MAIDMILLHGYYGERNAGDDAFTTICTERLSPLQGPVKVLTPTLPTVPNLPASPLLLQRRWRGLADRIEDRRIKAALHAGARLVIGGGSLLRTSGDIFALTRMLDHSPVGGHVALGVSIGPFRDAGAAAACTELLSRLDLVAVRDAASLQRGLEVAPQAALRLTFDLAPLLDRPAAPGRPAHGRLGIALHGQRQNDDHIGKVLALVHAWLQRHPDNSVVLVPFNMHPRKGDMAAHQKLRELIGPRSVLAPYDGNPRHLWRLVASLDALVAERLHAAVFGYCNSVPSLLLPYEEKGAEWARMVGHPEALVLDSNQVTPDLVDLLDTKASLPLLPVEEAISRAMRNFEELPW